MCLGVSVCVREVTLKPHCRPDHLAKDCVWPLWWPQPQNVKDLEKKAQSEEKTDPEPAAALARGLAQRSLGLRGARGTRDGTGPGYQAWLCLCDGDGLQYGSYCYFGPLEAHADPDMVACAARHLSRPHMLASQISVFI